ncbi:Multidrug resistance protein fnx1 [Tolypocladium paradoxum]|uniref:Multidrug resistance protein fnx1 n=1 Tax=Tolypocladium paradoxum TaxID=94208 RepID=A0A2S4KPY0_9HYPO|nr:Multidrug resistance protein fnx1 [Tolypocladium paradoxum]
MARTTTSTSADDANMNIHAPNETTPLLPQSSRDKPQFLNETSPGRFWVVFSQVLILQFIGCFDGTIMASSHPVITSYFGAAQSASWLSTSFLLTSTAFQPLFGRLSDAVWPQTLVRLVPSHLRLRNDLSNIIYGVGCALGAALGGVMAETLGWRWEFGIQVPVMLLCLGISIVAIPGDIGLQGRSKGIWVAIKEFDGKGSVLLATSSTALILGLNLGGNVLPCTTT